MTGGRIFWIRFVAASHFVALALWVAALVSAGVTAAGAFATLPGLGITLEGYSLYEPGGAELHGRLAAGQMLEPIFASLDMAQAVLAVTSLATLIAWVLLSGAPFRRMSLLPRLSSLVVATVLLAAHLALIAPRMNRELRAYWSAAEAGDGTLAGEHHDAFARYHPRAEAILKVNLVLVLVALASGAWSIEAPACKAGELEPPRLARRAVR